MTDPKTRVDLGFQGGGMVTARLSQSDIDALQKAVEKGEGWHSVMSDDGEISLRLDRVVYLRREAPEQRVGF